MLCHPQMSSKPTVARISIVEVESQWDIHIIVVNNNTKSSNTSKYTTTSYVVSRLRLYPTSA